MGFLRVANESMCRPIRELTQSRGYHTKHHVLASFGGAGGQHACAIGRMLGMKTVFVHKYAGILSAVGIALADVVREAQEPCAKVSLYPSLTLTLTLTLIHTYIHTYKHTSGIWYPCTSGVGVASSFRAGVRSGT